MYLKDISDDFFCLNGLSVLQKKTNNLSYDFDFRQYFICKSIQTVAESPILLHIGAIEDYARIETEVKALGMSLLMNHAEHQKCSTIEHWYPLLQEKTPRTKVYESLPDISSLMQDFHFPVFIKGNRQTNRHQRAQCIIQNKETYEDLCCAWQQDVVLSWQKVAVREFVLLQKIDDTTFPNLVPISYEFRFFYFYRQCVAYGPYWTNGPVYHLQPDEIKEAISLTQWAADRLRVPFLAIDIAKTEDGDWIIIEVNDAQESGFVGANPLMLWKNVLE